MADRIGTDAELPYRPDHPGGTKRAPTTRAHVYPTDVINRTMFSSDVLPEVEEIGPAVDTALRYISRRERAIFRIPRSWPTFPARRFRDAMDALDGYLYRLIGERRAAPRGKGDLLDMLLEACDEATGDGMSDVEIRDEVATIYGAEHATTANALTWAWYALMEEPEILGRLQRELDSLPAELVPADLDRLGYTRMVLEESMRLYPPVPLNGRWARCDTKLAGFHVPKGAAAVIAVTNIHRHPTFWDEPDQFESGRFAPDRIRERHKYAYLPFGAGPHLCIGNHFAVTEATLLLATMAQHFEFEAMFERPVPRTVAITLQPAHGLPIRVHRR